MRRFGRDNEHSANLSVSPHTLVLRLAWLPLALVLSREVKLLALVSGALRKLVAEPRVAQEVRRIDHSDGILLLLRQVKELGDVRQQGVENLFVNGRVLEVQKPDINSSVAQLENKLVFAPTVDEIIVEDGDTIEVGSHVELVVTAS